MELSPGNPSACARPIVDLSQSGLSQDLRELRPERRTTSALLNLSSCPCAEINLNDEAKRYTASRPGYYSSAQNPFLRPEDTQALIENFHRELQVRWSYGGYLEDRSFIWAGSYLEQSQSFIHAGIDFYVPAGVGVVATLPLKVLVVDNDVPELHGWGGRVIATPVGQKDNMVLIFAHLQSIGCDADDVLSTGSIFAETGEPQVNGGWFPHLHIQAVRRDFYEELSASGLQNLDGYFPARDMAEIAPLFPNPLPYLV